MLLLSHQAHVAPPETSLQQQPQQSEKHQTPLPENTKTPDTTVSAPAEPAQPPAWLWQGPYQACCRE